MGRSAPGVRDTNRRCSEAWRCARRGSRRNDRQDRRVRTLKVTEHVGVESAEAGEAMVVDGKDRSVVGFLFAEEEEIGLPGLGMGLVVLALVGDCLFHAMDKASAAIVGEVSETERHAVVFDGRRAGVGVVISRPDCGLKSDGDGVFVLDRGAERDWSEAHAGFELDVSVSALLSPEARLVCVTGAAWNSQRPPTFRRVFAVEEGDGVERCGGCRVRPGRSARFALPAIGVDGNGGGIRGIGIAELGAAPLQHDDGRHPFRRADRVLDSSDVAVFRIAMRPVVGAGLFVIWAGPEVGHALVFVRAAGDGSHCGAASEAREPARPVLRVVGEFARVDDLPVRAV